MEGEQKINLLVCGGAGFIGSNFVCHMLEAHPAYKIVNYDKLTYAGNLDNLKDIVESPNYKFVQGDIVDLDKLNYVIKENQITHVINFAAETHVDRSIHGGCKDFVLTNTLGVQMILDAVRINGIQKFVNVSTDEVYGALELDEDREFTESTSIMPNMPYAAAKAGGDLMCNAYFKTHNVPVVVTHCSNNYGPYQFPEKLIPYFIFKLMKGEKVPVYGDGMNVRDWIHVRDHAKALDLLLHQGVPGEVYNIGSDNERSNMDVTKKIIEIIHDLEEEKDPLFKQVQLKLNVKKDGSESAVKEYVFGRIKNINFDVQEGNNISISVTQFDKKINYDEKIEYVKDRPGHDRRYAIDASKIKRLGWKADYPRDEFERGLRETVEWYLKNTEWVENLWKKKDEMNKWQQNFFSGETTTEKGLQLSFKEVELKNIPTDKCVMTPIELKDYIDFEVKRNYFMADITAPTGAHCHKIEKEFFVLMRGTCTAVIDRGQGLEEIKMTAPKSALYVGAYVWHHFKDFSKDGLLLALSSTNYNPDRSDYIEDYEEYLKVIEQK